MCIGLQWRFVCSCADDGSMLVPSCVASPLAIAPVASQVCHIYNTIGATALIDCAFSGHAFEDAAVAWTALQPPLPMHLPIDLPHASTPHMQLTVLNSIWTCHQPLTYLLYTSNYA